MPNPKTCRHVSAAMIAAGFLVCGECEQGGVSPADNYGSVIERAEQRVERAYIDLGDRLDVLAAEATKAAKATRRKRPAPDMDRLRAAIRDVDLAEQTVDTAVYDLSTARGADG